MSKAKKKVDKNKLEGDEKMDEINKKIVEESINMALKGGDACSEYLKKCSNEERKNIFLLGFIGNEILKEWKDRKSKEDNA